MSVARNVKTILESYYSVIGQLVNYHKLMVQFSKRNERRQKLGNRDILQIPTPSSIVTYLDFRSIDHKRLKKR